ncbi:MAG: hypothetical protein OXG35_22775 [Acidobacteria bacterium]|nr:hypothetical protein [Acidobacteriota bacterium]
MRTMRIAVAATVMLVAVPAEAQEELPRGTVEGGLSQFGVSIAGISFTHTGFYAGATGRFHDRGEVFGAFSQIEGQSFAQAGAQLRLGPDHWIARPGARGGILYADGGTRVTGGFAVRVGRQYGGLWSADYTTVEGLLVRVVHIGGYYGF